MRQSVLSSVAAACLALAAAHASADTVRIDGFTFDPPKSLVVSAPAYAGPAGQFTGELNGASFTTYCADLAQAIAFGATYTDYSVVSGAVAWGAQKSSDLDRAFSAFMRAGFPTNADQSAVAQAIVWEILYETSGTYGFGSGSFTVSSADAATQAALGTINWPALPGEAISYYVDQLYSRNTQDLVVVTAVPEPSTYALMFAGLVGIGFVSRRRAQQQR
jgi:PEP-CTERM motif